MNVNFYESANCGVSMRSIPCENFTYEILLTFLQVCSAYLARLTCVVCEMRSKCFHNCCFVGRCLLDLVAWLLGIKTFVGYLMPKPFLYKWSVRFQTIHFSIRTLFKCKYKVWMSKIFLFQVIQFSQTVLIQTIHFSISIVFVHTQLNVKKVIFQTIQLSISTRRINFFLSRIFCPHLISFCVVSSSQRFGQISPLVFFRWFNHDLG